ncbi:hypothetical protein KM295_05120 [Natronomonas sp. F2-12]|jgi:hypothetical protein|uniref:Cyclophilin TM1367-like domain-containing protein n=1 Tax=Natronomonas aquatica TaxID=2841590 RepID=A0A9R1D6C7_9EURY|nr:cyclophilin-like family protein [Natronomonas aquatica]MCQ4332887.1 hypothetical protein [Natronomonas aquatica]
MSDLRVLVDGTELSAGWNDGSPETRRAIEDALPIEGEATRWGEELYFGTDIDVPAESPRATVEPGALAYWPQGNAVCLFWGPTPASTGDEPKAASPVNVFANADVSAFDPGAGGATLRLEAGKRNE